MASKLRQTALKFIGGFKDLSSDTILAVSAPTYIHEFAPASVNPPPPKSSEEFAKHLGGLREILSSCEVIPKEVFENEGGNQVTVWATSRAIFKEEVKDDGLSGDEWYYEGEYIFILTMDESKERITRVIEFLDSKGTERLLALMARAKRNLEPKK